MKFFDKKCIDFALSHSPEAIKMAYEISEEMLVHFAQCGDIDNLIKSMEGHKIIEYAMLFQLSPYYKNMSKKSVAKTTKNRK